MLKFNVFNQRLIRIDKNNPATDSVEYLEAQFIFNTDDWNGKTKSAIFTKGTSSYTVLLDSKGVCKVPFEVLQSNESSKLLGNTDKISVTLVGIYDNVRITTNELKINLNYSGYSEGQEPSEPTAEMYEQILTAYADAEAKCEETQQAFIDTLGLYSNAIKGSVSGTTVSANDVSPIEHELQVYIGGKNHFFSNKDLQGTIAEISYSITENTSDMTLNGSATRETSITMPDSFVLQKGTYTASVRNSNENDRVFIRDRKTNKVLVNYITAQTPRTFTVSEKTDIRSYFVFKQGSTYDNTTIQIQIEKGDTVTDYEDWIVPTDKVVTADSVEYTATQNGTVEGIKSTALANGITTEAEGMTIDVEYNKDINKVLTKITDALGIEI